MSTMATPYRFRTEADFTQSHPNDFGARELRLADAILRNKNVVDTFESQPVVGGWNSADGLAVAAEPASGLLLAFQTRRAAYELYASAIETTGTAVAKVPTVSADGLELPQDANHTDGITGLEMTNGVTARSASAFVVGTSAPFFCEVTLKIDDISDVTELFYGFRKAEAYQADPDSYDEMAAFNIGKDADGQVEIHTILNNGATSETDTTETDVADGDEVTMRIEVDRLGRCKFLWEGAEPTVTKKFTFDDGEVVVPFLYLKGETGDAGVSISSWKVGRLN